MQPNHHGTHHGPGRISAELCARAGMTYNAATERYEFVDPSASSFGTPASTAAPAAATEAAPISKKQKKKAAAKAKNAAGSQGVPRSVRFGTCEELLFTRDVGFDGVPSKGGYSLGLGTLEARDIKSVDDYLRCQQAALRVRAARIAAEQSASLHQQHQHHHHHHHQQQHHHQKVASHSSRQPLLQDLDALETRQCDYNARFRNALFEPMTEEERLVALGPLLTAAKNNAKVATGSSQSQIIADLNKDVQNIRASRDTTGCSCKALKLDKLSVGRMKTELCRAGTDKEEVEKLTKADLIERVREVIQHSCLCTENCECAQMGVQCSAEVCGCLKHGKKCANPAGQMVFCFERVQEYRKKVLGDCGNLFA